MRADAKDRTPSPNEKQLFDLASKIDALLANGTALEHVAITKRKANQSDAYEQAQIKNISTQLKAMAEREKKLIAVVEIEQAQRKAAKK